MTVLVLIAWRNIWRNKWRTLVVVAAISVGLSAALFAVAFTRSLVTQLVNDVVSMEAPHLLVIPKADHSGYTPDTATPDTDRLPESDLFSSKRPSKPASHIADATTMAHDLEGIEGVRRAAARIVLPAILETAHATAHVTLLGVDPSAEKGLTSLHQRISPDEGVYFEGQASNSMVIGRRLAQDMQATLNTRILATFRDNQGELVSTLFRVTAIYDYPNSSFERGNAFVLREELANWYGSAPGEATEIALRLEGGLLQTSEMHQKVRQWLDQHPPSHPLAPTKVQTWKELRPEMAFFFKFAGLISTIILGFILSALGLVVVNTMHMVVNERRTELGVLRALGMKDSRLITMMTLETFFMMLPGVAISLCITAILIAWLGTTGINLTMFSDDYHSPTHNYQSIITTVKTVYPVYYLSEVIRLSVMVVLTALLASWMPVRNALRIQPAEAVKEMVPPV